MQRPLSTRVDQLVVVAGVELETEIAVGNETFEQVLAELAALAVVHAQRDIGLVQSNPVAHQPISITGINSTTARLRGSRRIWMVSLRASASSRVQFIAADSVAAESATRVASATKASSRLGRITSGTQVIEAVGAGEHASAHILVKAGLERPDDQPHLGHATLHREHLVGPPRAEGEEDMAAGLGRQA